MLSKQQTKREDECEQELLKANEIITELKNENAELEEQNKQFQEQLKICRVWCKETLRGNIVINDKWFQAQIDRIDKLIGHEETCPFCNRLQYLCEKETYLEKNPITYWLDDNWGLSCDECWYAAHPESDKSENDEDQFGKGYKFIDKEGDQLFLGSLENNHASLNRQEVCSECNVTEKQYNKKNGYETNLSTLHYIGGNTYCLDCRDPENSDDEDF